MEDEERCESWEDDGNEACGNAEDDDKDTEDEEEEDDCGKESLSIHTLTG